MQPYHMFLGTPSEERDKEMWYAINFFKSLGAKPIITEKEYIRNSTFSKGGIIFIGNNGNGIQGNGNKVHDNPNSIEIKMPKGIFADNTSDFLL